MKDQLFTGDDTPVVCVRDMNGRLMNEGRGGATSASPAAPAHHRSEGGFRNPWLRERSARFGGFLRWVLLERPFKQLPPDPDPSVFPVVEPRLVYPRADGAAMTVTWVGHATVLLQLGGLNIVTDPMWSERASPVGFAGPRRWVRPGVSFAQLPPIDVVLLTHNHYDHLDARSVRELAERFPEACWLVPLGLAEFVRRRGARKVEQLDWWNETEVGDLRAACVPAQHFSGRGLADRNATLWCGWTLTKGERRVFFAGDSGYHPEFRVIGERYGPFDVTLLPVGAYEPAWFMQPAHMNPEEAVRVFCEMNGNRDGPPYNRRIMVPIHYATFKLTDEPLDEPPERTRQAWLRAGLPPENLWVLAHGETRAL